MFIDLKQLFDVVGSQRNIDQTIQFLEQDQHSTFPQPVAVSYTHLDVYKRQNLSIPNTKRRSFSSFLASTAKAGLFST